MPHFPSACECLPPPPIFDLPPPPDPSLILHLLLDGNDQPNGINKFVHISGPPSCASSSSALGFSSLAIWWANLEQTEFGRLLLPGLATFLLCLCLISSGAIILLRRKRRRKSGSAAGRAASTMNSSGGGGAGGNARNSLRKSKRPMDKNASATSPPRTLALPCSSSSSSGSPGHCGAHFSPGSSTETMASAASPDGMQHQQQKQQQQEWLFQPNFFATSNPMMAFRPNTVGAPRRKLPFPLSSVHHHLHSCCSPAPSSLLKGTSPPRTVALRLPRHFSSSDGQFVAWRTETPSNANGGCTPSSYGFYAGCGGGGSELYEELVGVEGETSDIAEAPYKRRQQPPMPPPVAPPRRMPPPASRPPPPPPADSASFSPTSPNGGGIGSSSGHSSVDDLEAQQRSRAGMSICGVGKSRNESGYGTGKSGQALKNDTRTMMGAAAAAVPMNGFWRGQQQQQYNERRHSYLLPNGRSPSSGYLPNGCPIVVEHCQGRMDDNIYQANNTNGTSSNSEKEEEADYVIHDGNCNEAKQQQKAMTYV